MRDRSLIREIRLPRMRCSVLQCVAVCCSVLRWAAWHIGVWFSWHASVLQRVANVAVCCSALQCVAVCRLVLGSCLSISLWFWRHAFSMCCNTCVATHVTPTCLFIRVAFCIGHDFFICVVLQQTAHATTQPCHTQTDFDCGLDQFRTEQFVPGLRCYDEMRLGLRKLVILHELILSRKIRISKSVYCDTHMPAAYVLPFFTWHAFFICVVLQQTAHATTQSCHILKHPHVFFMCVAFFRWHAFCICVAGAALCCSVSQCVAVYCSVLQCMAVPSSYVLQGVAVCCSVPITRAAWCHVYILCLFFMTLLIHTCYITHSHVRHDSCRCATWLTNPKGCFYQYHHLTDPLHKCLFAEYMSLL